MRLLTKILSVPLLVFPAVPSPAQTNNIPQIKHVIIVVQENRTPDNLFGSDMFVQTRQLPLADLATQGLCKTTGGEVSLQYAPLNSCFDPNHGHDVPDGINNAWYLTYDAGKMDGACTTNVSNDGNCQPPQPTYPQLTYVDNSLSNVQPYFEIAMNYGYANYMFQTNQGPSFQAHQFLFSGTSTFDDPNDSKDGSCGTYPCYEWFSADLQNDVGIKQYGCNAGTNNKGQAPDLYAVDPANNESNGVYYDGYPCYYHNSMADLLDNNTINGQKITWKYYAQGPNPATSLWTAPNAIYDVCFKEGTKTGQPCNSTDWQNDVAVTFPQPGNMAPILSDIENCKLPNVSWVIPDGFWSDHPGSGGGSPSVPGVGPAWVADIVNAVGFSYLNSDGKCDYWGTRSVPEYPPAEPTVILITWDDWGGSYTYGFRVPLLVVSAYNVSPGYISGACTAPGNCTNNKQPYIHDFGSILNFTEYVFGSGGVPLSAPGATGPWQGISPSSFVADYWAPDGYWQCYLAGKCQYPYSLGDFFNFSQAPTVFVPIPLPEILCNSSVCYNAQYFENYTGSPADPDNDNDW